MSYLVTIHGRGKTVSMLADGRVSWSSSSGRSYSEAEIFIPRNSVAWDADILRQEGGFLVEVGTPVGTFVGVADQPVPQEYGADLRIFGPQRWLEIRTVGQRAFRQISAGVIAREAIKDGMLGLAPVPIRHGTYLDAAPFVREIIFDGQSVMDVLVELMEGTGQRFVIDNRMRFHWRNVVGRYHPVWHIDDGKLLPNLQPLPLMDRIGENIQVEPSGRRFMVRREAQPILWPSQNVEST